MTTIAVLAVGVIGCEVEPPGPAPGTEDRLRNDASGVVEVEQSGPSTIVRGALPAAEPTEAGARSLLERYPDLFGLGEHDAFEPLGTLDAGDAVRVVRLGRTHRGHPVFDAEARVAFDAGGNPTFIVAPATGPLDVSPDPSVSSEDAQAAALAVITGPGPTVADARVGVFVPALHGYVGEPVLAHQIEIELADEVFAVVLVDATTAEVLVHFSTRAAGDVLVRQWSEGSGGIPTLDGPLLVTPPVEEPPAGASDLEVDAYVAYQAANVVHVTFDELWGWDSWDGEGGDYRLYVGQAEDNAYWYGSYASFGTDFVTLDVVAHELGHALIDGIIPRAYGSHFTGLVECGENDWWAPLDAAACGESMALDEWAGDFLSTIVEFAILPECATSSDCWQVQTETGVLRDMSQRAAFRTIIHKSEISDPRREHLNSAVPSLATYLLADPSPQHPLGSAGEPFRSIGIEAVAQIFFRALRLYLRATATFEDVRYAWLRSCEDFVSLGAHGLTIRDCGAVLNAWASVGVGEVDTDEDTWHDDIDNCPDELNPDQLDSDGDGEGDACETEPPPSGMRLPYPELPDVPPTCPETIDTGIADDPVWPYEGMDGPRRKSRAHGTTLEVEYFFGQSCAYRSPVMPGYQTQYVINWQPYSAEEYETSDWWFRDPSNTDEPDPERALASPDRRAYARMGGFIGDACCAAISMEQHARNLASMLQAAEAVALPRP